MVELFHDNDFLIEVLRRKTGVYRVRDIIGNYRIIYIADGEFHRLDGPAVIKDNGTELYYIYGEFLSKKEFYMKKYIIENELKQYQ